MQLLDAAAYVLVSIAAAIVVVVVARWKKAATAKAGFARRVKGPPLLPCNERPRGVRWDSRRSYCFE